MNRKREFDTNCRQIEAKSIRIDEEILEYLEKTLDDIKKQLPNMLQMFHQHLGDKLVPNEFERRVGFIRYRNEPP